MKIRIRMPRWVNWQTVSQVLLGIVGLFTVILIICIILRAPMPVESFSAIAGALAVLAAVIAALPSISALKLQQEALQPNPIPYFEVCPNGTLRICLKNFGSAAAYNVSLNWKQPPLGSNKQPITLLDEIKMIAPLQRMFVDQGPATEFHDTHGTTFLEGTVCFEDANRVHFSRPFTCQVVEYQGGYPYTHHLKLALDDSKASAAPTE